jgi:hypothetical protein
MAIILVCEDAVTLSVPNCPSDSPDPERMNVEKRGSGLPVTGEWSAW